MSSLVVGPQTPEEIAKAYRGRVGCPDTIRVGVFLFEAQPHEENGDVWFVSKTNDARFCWNLNESPNQRWWSTLGGFGSTPEDSLRRKLREIQALLEEAAQ